MACRRQLWLTQRKDVVQLVRHTARLGDVGDGSSSVELGSENVVHHTTGVSDSEATRLDSTDSRRSNNENFASESLVEDLTSVSLGNTFGDQSDSSDLGDVESLESALVDRARRSEVDKNICIRALLDCVLDGGENREQSLLGSPVEPNIEGISTRAIPSMRLDSLLDVVTTEWVDHGSDRRSLTAARIVEVQHALNSTGLETEDKGAGASIKGSVPRPFAGRGSSLERNEVAIDLRLGGLGGGCGAACSRRNNRDRGNSAAVDSLARRNRKSVDCSSGSLGLASTESEGNNLGDVGVWAEDLDFYTKSLSEETHGLESFLVVGSTSSNKDLDLVRLELLLELLQCSNDTLEGRCDVGEVGNTSSNDKELSLWVGCASGHQINCKQYSALNASPL